MKANRRFCVLHWQNPIQVQFCVGT
jgi:hypothetical protein